MLYDIVRPLGRGSHGQVYEIIDKDSKLRYAMKMVQKTDRKNFDQLRQEANILSQLDHPNIVRFISMEESQDYIFFFMELVEVSKV